MKKYRVFLIGLLWISLTLSARDLSLTVVDRDLEIPLEGTLITVVGLEQEFYTDTDGSAVLTVPDGMERVVLLISYPGYEGVRLPVASEQNKLLVSLVIAGFIEGEELVVERTAPGESDEEVGVSIVMDREEMNTTANIGIIEDVMSSIKTLPGVGYTSSWDAQPSIRGGDPDELAASLDGFYVTYPFHWGGGFSIFNPNMVETAKLSHGIYSARYGRALSGLLEITTKTPDEPEVRVDGSFSTSSTDLFIRSPLGKKSGLFLGGKITYLDTLKLIQSEELEDMTTMPFIRDLYGKWYYRPSNELEIYLNGFLGTDGIGVDTTAEGDDGFTTDIYFDYDYINSFLAGGAKWAPSNTFFVDFLTGYNWNIMNMEFDASNSGSREYSQEFIDEYGTLLGLSAGDSYTIDGLRSSGTEDLDIRQFQMKLTGEKLLNPDNILAVGVEEVFKQTNESSEFAGWMSFPDESGGFNLEERSFSSEVEGNNSLNSAVFLLWENGSDQSRLNTELGLRGEFYRIWHDDFSMNALPVVNPRASVTWTALEDRYGLDKLDLSLGTGVFSSFPLTVELFEEQYGVDDWSINPDQALFNVAGAELHWHDQWKLSAETYYKHYLNRLVLTTEQDKNGESQLYYNTDGRGRVVGFDLMLQKKAGRKWDGYLTYSFIYARFYNPSNTGTAEEAEDSYTNSGEPLDEWFFPYYHRFHNLNLVFNWHFHPGWTFSILGSLASGAPREEVGDVSMYPAVYESTYIEQYARDSSYSNSLRNGISVPIDLRIAYGHYREGAKVYWEWYVAVEDILASFYAPSANSDFNSYTGEENTDTSADFNLGIPVPSFGIKVSY